MQTYAVSTLLSSKPVYIAWIQFSNYSVLFENNIQIELFKVI